jgi:elongator complex protein 5
VNSTFNLGLTDSQRASRAEVPIPYAHEGQSLFSHVPSRILLTGITLFFLILGDDAPNAKRYDTTNTGAGIIFEPGSDDDVDDDDPDDDLDF